MKEQFESPKLESKNICLLDNSLVSTKGHHFTYAYSLYSHAQESSARMTIFGNKSVADNVTEIMPVVPTFRYTFYDRASHVAFLGKKLSFYANEVLDFIQTNFSFYRDLQNVFRERRLAECLVFMPMVDHRYLIGWWLFLALKREVFARKVVLMFRLTYFQTSNSFPARFKRFLARLSFEVLEIGAVSKKIRIATDSEHLAREYARLTRLPIQVFPIPHAACYIGKECGPAMSPKTRKGLVLITLGDAREEKGFLLIEKTIRKLQDINALENLYFRLHCYIASPLHHAMSHGQKSLQEMQSPNIELITHPLSLEKYRQLLEDADIVLLPYNQDVYRSRTSGPLAEAFAAGKPVIVTEGTWMSEQVAIYGGGITFKDGDADDLARAILTARANYPTLAKQAQEGRPKWLGFHNPATFFNMLLNCN